VDDRADRKSSGAANLRWVLPATLLAWILVIVALGYRRVGYAWCPGALVLFLFRDIPLTLCGVIVVLVFEFLVFRKKIS